MVYSFYPAFRDRHRRSEYYCPRRARVSRFPQLASMMAEPVQTHLTMTEYRFSSLSCSISAVAEQGTRANGLIRPSSDRLGFMNDEAAG